MADYRIYRDYGDETGTEYTCRASCIRDLLNKIIRTEGNAPSEFSVRLNAELLAVVTLDQFGNWSAEVLESRSFPIDVAYPVGQWANYARNGLGEWIRLSPVESFNCHD